MDRFPIFIIACVTAIVIIVSGLIFLNVSIRDNVERAVYSDVKVATEQQANNFSSRLGTMTDMLTSLSQTIPIDELGNSAAIAMLSTFAQETEFDGFFLIDSNGNMIDQHGQTGSREHANWFIDHTSGRTSIQGPFFADTIGEHVVTISAPINRDGRQKGVLVGVIKAAKLDKWMLRAGHSSVYIADNSGEIIANVYGNKKMPDYGDNLFKAWAQASFYDGADMQQMTQNLVYKNSGYTKYNHSSQNYMLYYTQVPNTDWHIFSIVQECVIDEFKDNILNQIYALSAVILLLSAGFLYWMIKMQINHVRRIEETAFYDQLTGAPTLLKFKLDVQKLLDAKPGKVFVLAKFDIDRFKLINKTLGYAEGDRVIRNVINALAASVRSESEKYARVNIDEFVVLHEIGNVDSVAALKAEFVRKFMQLMGEEFKYNIRFPAGCCLVETGINGEDVAALLEKANIAHRRAKQQGLDLCVYDDSIVQADLERKEIENKMESALASGEFKLFLQPKYSLTNEKIVGAEALVRWRDKYGDMMYPNAFIPLFEENGFILKLDTYIFEEVCKTIREWLDNGIKIVPVSVNFSRNQLNNESFVDMLCMIADKYHIPHELLEIELTESVIIENEAMLLNVLKKLHAAGFKLAMDDFGTGYSSLGMLKNIPVDIIKIDRSFFTANMDDLRAKVVIVHIMEMARELGIVTVAEGIETKEYIAFLRAIKCDMVQGYYYSKPVPVSEFNLKLLSEES